MRGFKNMHAYVNALFYIAVAGIAMFSYAPMIACISFSGAFAYFIRLNGFRIKDHVFMIILFFVLSIINPMINHAGVTPMIIVNDTPITLEALLYGMSTSLMILSVIYWFRTFNIVMTSDKLLTVFGFFSPKLSLVLSMALRFIPLFARQIRKTKDSLKATGMYNEDNFIDKIKNGINVFSIIVTWALENGIVCADSMEGRGYGTGRRSSLKIQKFTKNDGVFAGVIALLGAVTVRAFINKSISAAFFPKIIIKNDILGAGAYLLLAFMPLIIDICESVIWRARVSRIGEE